MKSVVFVAFLIAAMTASGCMYTVVDTRRDERIGSKQVLEKQKEYRVAGATLAGDTLTLSLDRTCVERQSLSIETTEVEHREYHTELAWIGVASILATGLTGAFAYYQSEDPCWDTFSDSECAPEKLEEKADIEDTAMNIVYGTLAISAIASAIVLYYELGEPESTRVLGTTQEERLVEASCGSWPQGNASLMAPSAGQELSGKAGADGRVDVDISMANSLVWSGETLQLQLPDTPDWVAVDLPPAVLTAGRELAGEALIRLTISLDDSKSNNDGALSAGESAYLRYEVINSGTSTARDLSILVGAEGANGVDIESPVKLNAVGPGETAVGTIDINADDGLASGSLALEAILYSGTTPTATDRSKVELVAADATERVYIRYEADSKNEGLLEAGATRVQSVLTGTRRYQFVSDQDTRGRIEEIVESGGGSLEDRQKTAIEAARQENISKVIQLSVTTISGTQVQLVLTVHSVVSGDRIFLKDAPADTSDAFQALAVFDELANAFLDWERQ